MSQSLLNIKQIPLTEKKKKIQEGSIVMILAIYPVDFTRYDSAHIIRQGMRVVKMERCGFIVH